MEAGPLKTFLVGEEKEKKEGPVLDCSRQQYGEVIKPADEKPSLRAWEKEGGCAVPLMYIVEEKGGGGRLKYRREKGGAFVIDLKNEKVEKYFAFLWKPTHEKEVVIILHLVGKRGGWRNETRTPCWTAVEEEGRKREGARFSSGRGKKERKSQGVRNVWTACWTHREGERGDFQHLSVRGKKGEGGGRKEGGWQGGARKSVPSDGEWLEG